MTTEQVLNGLTAIRYAMDELPGHVNVLLAEADETFGVRIQIESGSGWFGNGQPHEWYLRTAKEGYGIVERSRVVCGVKVFEVERQ